MPGFVTSPVGRGHLLPGATPLPGELRAAQHLAASRSLGGVAWQSWSSKAFQHQKMDLVWFYHGFTMVLPWFYSGFTMGLLWFTPVYYGFTMVLLWFYYGFIGMIMG